MSITGKNALSIRKTDVKESKSLAQGFVKLVFAHKASAGESSISLGGLTTPTEMSALGFTNPSPSKLTEAKLFQFKNNLTLVSSLRGHLMQDLSYRIASNSSIVFEGFTAEEGEIFTGVIDANPISGIQVIDAKQAVAKGDLAVGVTDFNLGFSTKTGSEDIIVIRGGLVQTRNTNNSSTVLDGNYYVVDSGSGYGSVVRFNVSPSGSADSVLVVALGGIVESPTNSTWDELEKVQGQIDAMVPVLAETTELPESTFQSAPNNVDLKQFGDIVIGLLDMEVPIKAPNVSFTPTASWSSNITWTGKYSRDGKYALIQYDASLSNTSEAALLTIDMPPGLLIDTAELVRTVGPLRLEGSFTTREAGVGEQLDCYPRWWDATKIAIGIDTATSTYTQSGSGVSNTVPFSWAAGDYLSGFIRVPIVGWEETQTLREHLESKGIL